jgi:nitroimidazol reductase NimA-like FMN-containing flavoprotein (pyridoxamine 5'-phosphate oxidase superfamily)
VEDQQQPDQPDEYDIIVDDLDEPTCWRLLGRAGFGRVGFVVDGEITVLPVNAALSQHRVVFRTAEGTSLASAGTGSDVVFEADHTDRVMESGWSVIVRGRLWDVTDRPETSTWHELVVRPWAPRPRNVWMMIEPERITGRMIHRHRNLPDRTRMPYMPPD